MTITIYEAWPSGQLSLQNGELEFVIVGTDSYIAAFAAMVAYVPINSLETIGGMPIQDISVSGRLAEQYWTGTLKYSWASRPAGEWSYNFEVGGGSQRIQQSIATVNKYAPPGKTAPENYGAINVSRSGVEGVDISLPTYNFSFTRYYEVAEVDESFEANVFFHAFTVNNATFRGFSPGEVLFVGASGSQKGEQPWEITYRFSSLPNATGLSYGTITGIDKKGWDYLWVRYEDEVDGTAKQLVKKPLAVYVEQVYGYTDLNDLEIF